MQREAGENVQGNEKMPDNRAEQMKSFLEEQRAKEQDNQKGRDPGHEDGIEH